jgi:hypothetical protein
MRRILVSGWTLAAVLAAGSFFASREAVRADSVLLPRHAVADDCGCEGAKDFVTGGGWIAVNDAGDHANFGVGGGIRRGHFWGHLLYIDHSTGMKVKGTGVTGYEVVDETTRRITGECRIDGEDGFTYEVEVSDRGEPGRDDTFSIKLSTGYSASGALDGGNIQLHEYRGR